MVFAYVGLSTKFELMQLISEVEPGQETFAAFLEINSEKRTAQYLLTDVI